MAAAATATTAAAASALVAQPAQPHPFVIPAAKQAIRTTGHAVEKITDAMGKIGQQTNDVKGTSKDPSKLDAAVAFYKTACAAKEAGEEAIRQLQAATLKCHGESVLLPKDLQRQYGVLGTTGKVKQTAESSEKDKKHLAEEIITVKERVGNLTQKLSALTIRAAQECKLFLQSKNAYTKIPLLGKDTSTMYWNEYIIPHYEAFKAKEARPAAAPAAAPAKVPFPAADVKAGPGPAADAENPTEPNPNHVFSFPPAAATNAAYQQLLTSLGRKPLDRTEFFPAEGYALLGEILQNLPLFATARDAKKRKEVTDLIQKMGAIRDEILYVGLRPLPPKQKKWNEDVGLTEEFVTALRGRQTDANKLEARILFLLKWQEARDAELKSIGNACLDYLCARDTVKLWGRLLISWEQAIALVETEAQSKAAAASAAASPPATTAAK